MQEAVVSDEERRHDTLVVDNSVRSRHDCVGLCVQATLSSSPVPGAEGESAVAMKQVTAYVHLLPHLMNGVRQKHWRTVSLLVWRGKVLCPVATCVAIDTAFGVEGCVQVIGGKVFRQQQAADFVLFSVQ
ncbi:hypothetical protein TGGT1_322400 [Toxoplasma gondii GT1]|uniref:Uncharacterized protein n=1 Tax=Toxoplasma gondii (strain ATCC 50853 / GT1) TaxID=507601 RepID=S7UG54_TOXGG|nr:hypothetical protein TGGT1_322400 [Toxoplasma gondii GT1]